MRTIQAVLALLPLALSDGEGNVEHSNIHSHVRIEFGPAQPRLQAVSPGVATVVAGLKDRLATTRAAANSSKNSLFGAGVSQGVAGGAEDVLDYNGGNQTTEAEAKRTPRQFSSRLAPALLSPRPLSADAEVAGQEEREGRQLLLAGPRPVCSELVCVGAPGPVTSPLDCPAGQQEVCLEVTETECTTAAIEECRQYEETQCQAVPAQTCFQADQTTCTDTDFSTPCLEAGEQCRDVVTQECGDPVAQEVCADITQVRCEPEDITLCKTAVTVEVTEECLEVQETECQETFDHLCFLGFGPGECSTGQVEECKYAKQQCTGYQCKPQQQKVCNYVSKTDCHYHQAAPRCKSLPGQKCSVTPGTRCIKVPKVVAREECQTRTVNNCQEVPTKECLTVYKTQCEDPETQRVCFDISGGCEGERLTNRVCEGQKQDVCITTNETVCTTVKKELCFTIPSVTCVKVPVKKCFTVPTPPALQTVPVPCGSPVLLPAPPPLFVRSQPFFG